MFAKLDILKMPVFPKCFTDSVQYLKKSSKLFYRG
jgi:hypothetical protein